MHKSIVLRPRMSEKAYGLSQSSRTYVFEVPASLSKHTVARAVEAQFEVKVSSVNVANVNGKAKRTVSKKGRMVVKGRSSDLKKAYVTLIEGQGLPIFAAIEAEEAKQEETQSKIDKAAAKVADKDAKKAEKAAKKEKK